MLLNKPKTAKRKARILTPSTALVEGVLFIFFLLIDVIYLNKSFEPSLYLNIKTSDLYIEIRGPFSKLSLLLIIL